MSKNVAMFVDVANMYYAARGQDVDVDYVALLKHATKGRDLIRAYAYTGLDPENENQRKFIDFLAKNGYKPVVKDIRKFGDGRMKANLDIELVVDMMKTARNLDIAIVVSGDGDFAPAIRAVQEMGVRVEVISFRGNTSSDLIEVADQFTDITQLARVEKGSRSGRRVADDDADLSMTEVPDKQTEGTGVGRGTRGGRGRSRTRATEAEGATASAGATSGRRGRASSNCSTPWPWDNSPRARSSPPLPSWATCWAAGPARPWPPSASSCPPSSSWPSSAPSSPGCANPPSWPPCSTASTIEAKLSSVSTMSDASLVTSVPVTPIAIPTSAALMAGASFTPSPVIATTCLSDFHAFTIRSL